MPPRFEVSLLAISAAGFVQVGRPATTSQRIFELRTADELAAKATHAAEGDVGGEFAHHASARRRCSPDWGMMA